MRVALNVPADPAALRAATMGLVALNRVIMRRRPLPPLYRSGVRYRIEGVGNENWNTADVVFRKGIGDCEDLAAWRVAELQLAGELGAMPHIIKTGFKRYHAQVRRADGRIEDPSRVLGMGRHG